MGGLMEIMSKRDTCSGKWVLLLAALIVLARVQPGFTETTDISETRMAAEKGDAEAQFNLAIMYDNGEGVPRRRPRGGEMVSESCRSGVRPWLNSTWASCTPTARECRKTTVRQ